MRSSIWFTLLALTTLLFTGTAQAEQKETLGDWDVHYMVVNSTFLTPEVARAYGIVRSQYNAVVNISVLDAKTKVAQNVAVSGTATNLLGTKKPLTFKSVRDGDAIYALAVLSFRDQETFRFNLDIQQGDSRQTLKFQQKMYVD